MSDQDTRIHELEERIQQLDAEISDLRADNEALRRLSRRDSLTDLLNYRGGREEWSRVCYEAMRRDEPTSIAFLDLIGFKQINDHHGQPAGDRVLQAVAQALLKSTRPADIVCRPGGDEFVVILPRTDAVGATRAVRRIDTALMAMSVQLNGHRINGVPARYAHATESHPRTSSPLPLWDDVGTRIKAGKAVAVP